jgi:hypothetical protein
MLSKLATASLRSLTPDCFRSYFPIFPCCFQRYEAQDSSLSFDAASSL